MQRSILDQLSMKHEACRNVVITGVSGYLGQALLTEISMNPKVFIIGIDLIRPRGVDRLKNFKFYQLDLKNRSRTKEYLQKIYRESSKPLSIIHLAALFVKDFSLRDKYSERDYMENNLNTLQNVIDATDTQHVKRFIFLSTAIAKKSVGKGRKIPDKADIYADTKRVGERIVKTLRTNWIIVRPVRVIGTLEDDVRVMIKKKVESQKFHEVLARNIRTKKIPFDIVSQFMMNSFDEKGNTATLVVRPGNLRRTYLHLRDAAKAIAKLSLTERNSRSLINLSTDNPVSLEEIATCVVEGFDKLGFKVRMRVDDVEGADTVFLRKSEGFDWSPTLRSSNAVIRATVNQYLNNVLKTL